jgi:transcriptional regulator with XRE-family HTH domain
MKTVADRVKWLREQAGISQRELCRLAGTNENQISLIERGLRNNIEIETAEAIADVFGVTLDWLMRGRGKIPSASEVIVTAGTSAARKKLGAA